jgi:hypothetical protein
MLAYLVSCGGCSGDCWHLKVGHVVLVVCNCSLELLSKDCSGACFVMVLFSSLASLLKLVIAVCLNSGLCEYPTYRLTLLVSVASVPMPCFDPMVFYVNYDE